MEIWKDIKNYEGLYQVSIFGRVKSLRGALQSRILKPTILNNGYHLVYLYKNKLCNPQLISRLVAIAFICNYDNKRTVNHKNGIKADNRLTNLEWATHSENQLHAYRELGRKSPMFGRRGINNPNSKAVNQFTLNGEFISEYGSGGEAQRETGIDQGSISSACNDKLKSAGGFIWKFQTAKQ